MKEKELPKLSYSNIVRELESTGWIREQLVLNETNTTFIEVDSLPASSTGIVVSLKNTDTTIMTIMGEKDPGKKSPAKLESIYPGVFGLTSNLSQDARKAYPTRLRLANNLGQDISLTTKLQIFIESDILETEPVSNIFYADISMVKNQGTFTDQIFKTDPEWYRFKGNVVMMPGDMLRFNVINPNIDIDSENTLFAIRLDLWDPKCF